MVLKKHLLCATAMVGAGIAMAPGVCAAAGADSAAAGAGAGDNSVAEVIVTAQKRSESINTVPLTITAATGAQLAALGVKDPADLVKLVPGFQAVQTQIGSPVYFLRGVGYDDVSVAARPSVTLYVDEAPLPYSVMAVGTSLDLERVEVLKGPQGLLFGANSTGGAINFIAAKPTSTLKYGVDASLGRFYENSLSGFVSGPIVDGLNARLAVSHDGSDAWQYDYLSGKKIGARDITSARLTLDAKPADRLRMVLTLSGTLDKSDPQLPQYVGRNTAINSRPAIANYPIAPRNDRATSFDPTGIPAGQFSRPLRRDNSQYQATLRGDYDVTRDITLTSLTSVAHNKQDYGLDADGMNLHVLDFTVIGKIRTFSQELRLAGTFNERSHWIVGANIEYDKTNEVVPANIVDSTTALAFAPFGLGLIDFVPIAMDTKFNSQAVFANVDYAATDKLTVHAGIRYTETETKDRNCAVIAGNLNSPTGIFLAFGVPNALSKVIPGNCFTLHYDNGVPTPQAFNDKLKENNVSWRVGADYKPTDDAMVYATISRGYKAGAYASLSAAIDTALFPATQEKLTSYELGAKVDVIPRVLHVNAALYYYDYGDKQLQGTKNDPVFGPLQSLVNIPKSRIQGFELEGVLRPVDGLTLGGTVTYVDSKVTSSFVNPTRFGVPVDLKGSSFPNTPKWQAAANVEYRRGVTSDIDAFIGANVTYRSTSYRDFVADDRLKIPSYTLVDAQVGLEAADKRWLVQIYGRNIFNKYYWTNQIYAQETLVRYAGRPGTYGVRLSYRY